MRKLYYFIVPLILFAFISESFAQKAPPAATFHSILDGGGMPGSFSNGNYWSFSAGGPAAMDAPGTSDIVLIEEDMELDLSYSYFNYLAINTDVSLSTTTNNLEVKGGGTLIVNGTLEVWDLTFDNGSIISVGSTGQIIVHNNFTNKNNSDNVQIDGSVSVTGEFYNGNGGVIVGSGSINASTYTGTGSSFGISPNSSIPAGSTIPSGTLPVELISFTAEVTQSGEVILKWTTASEINNAYFTVERTQDGINFETIGNYKGAGNSNSILNYIFTDPNPVNGLSYYKLKQTDFDGQFTYSDLIQVKVDNKDQSMQVFPNPGLVGSDSRVVFTGFDSDEEITIAIYNIVGELQFSRTVNSNIDDSRFSLDPDSRLSPGTYIIIGTSVDQTFKQKYVIR